MSAEASLPPRTWRQWWGQTASWFRIAVWGATTAVILNLALAARIAIGLQESSTVAEFRQRGHLGYFWQQRNERFEGEHWLAAGLYGRRPGCLTIVNLHPSSSDDDLRYIATHFRSLRQLWVMHSDVSSEGLRSLKACRDIESLDLTDAVLGDDDLEFLLSFPRLQNLNLSGTQITDAAIPLLERLPPLQYLDVSHTLLSQSRLEELARARGHSISAHTRSKAWRQKHNLPDVVAAIRWADGSVCERFPGRAEVFLEPERKRFMYPYDDSADGGYLGRTMLSGQVANLLKEVDHDLAILTEDGGQEISLADNPMKLQLGGYESAPVPLIQTNGKLDMHYVEFQMPVTREEAMKQQVQP
jgi:hypothetical protein